MKNFELTAEEIQRRKRIHRIIKEKSKVELIYLPCYALHLSLIESIWKYLKKTILYNPYYPKFKEFTGKLGGFLRQDQRMLFKQLLTEKFHFSSSKRSPLSLSKADT